MFCFELVTVGIENESGIVRLAVVRSRPVPAIVASPAYFAARGKPKDPRDLRAHDCINYRRITRGEIYRWEFSEDGAFPRGFGVTSAP